MRLVRDVDVVLDPDHGRVGEYDREAVVRLFREYEFRTSSTGCRRSPASAPRTRSPRCASCARPGSRRPRAAARAARARRGGAAERGSPDDGSLQLSMDFDVVSGGGDRPRRHAIAATSAAVEARAEALASATGDLPGRSRRPSSTRAGSSWPTRPASPPWSPGCASRRRWASPSCSTTRGRSRARRCPSPWPAPTARASPPRGRRRPSPCATSWSGSGRRSSATRRRRC